MTTKIWSSEEPRENPHKVDVRQLYNKESAQIMHITLKKGERLKPHKTPVDVAFYILEGRPTIHIGEESDSFPVDTLIESPAEIVHFISNEQDERARIMVIKAPGQQKGTRLL